MGHHHGGPHLIMNATSPSPGVISSEVFFFKPPPPLPSLPPLEPATRLIADNTLTRPPEIVHGLLNQGEKGVLAGASKSFKSWVELDLGVCVATGSPFFGRPTTRGKVLYVNLEIPKVFMRDRVNAVLRRRGITNIEGLDILNLRGKVGYFEALIASIIEAAKGKNYVLIIIDPIYKAMGGRSENSASGVGGLANQLERLAEGTGAAVFFTHHFTKGDAKKKSMMDRMSGSGVFARDADTIITLTEHSMPDCFTVEMTLRNFPPQDSFVVQWDFPIMIEREDLDPEDIDMEGVETMDNDQGLLALLNNGPLSNVEWQAQADGLGHSRATYYRIRRRLIEEGLVQFDRVINTWSFVMQVDDAPTVPPSSHEPASAGVEPVPAPRIEPPLAPWERPANRPAGAEQEDITGLWQGEPTPAR